MTNLNFEKWQACGNDFLIINHMIKPSTARKICDRHFGVGADGVLITLESQKADSKMIIFNSDGSQAEMCGNGIRCMAQYLSDQSGASETSIETVSGIKQIKILEPHRKISVQMGRVSEDWSSDVELPDDVNNIRIYTEAVNVNMGNPHCVIFLHEYETQNGAVERYGNEIEHMTDLFPEGTNVEFVTVKDPSTLRVRVWERGCGRTLACGTGACASVYAAYIKAKVTSEHAKVILDGGEVDITLSDADGGDFNRVELVGPAERVYAGQIELPEGV